jgi:SAM-dependent methyltransferase
VPGGHAPPQDSSSLKSYYDARYAGDYMAEHSPLEIERVAEVLTSVPAAAVRTILDFGCGRGAWTAVLRQRFPGARPTGLDVSEAAVARAAAEFPDATFAAFDGDVAPYGERAFDLVFSYHVLEHVLSLQETAAEMSRLADRWICVCLPCRNHGSLEERMVQLNGGLERTAVGELRFAHDEAGHLRRPTSDEVAAVFASNGFTVVDAFFSNQFWGGIEFLLEAGPEVTHRVFGPRQRLYRAALDAGHVLFRAHRSARWNRSREPLRRRALRVALVATKPLTAAVVAPVRGLTRREWKARKHDPSGSAQYLVLERTPAPGR